MEFVSGAVKVTLVLVADPPQEILGILRLVVEHLQRMFMLRLTISAFLAYLLMSEYLKSSIGSPGCA